MARPDDSLEDAILAGVDGRLLDVHTQLRGNVVSYDESAKTCEVQIGTKIAVPDGDGGFVYQAIPNLTHVPVAWPSAGGFLIHFPLSAGDSVFVTFDEQDSQLWETSGNVCEPAWLERFGLSSALAHPYSRKTLTTNGAGMVCPSPFSFGEPAAAKFVSDSTKVDQAWAALFTAMAGLPAGPLAGSALSAAFATLAGAYLPSAVGKLKSE